MTDKQTFVLINDRIRHNAMAAVMQADANAVVNVGPPKRSLDQNAMFHAICGDIAKAKLIWAGKVRKADEWKVLLVSAHTKATSGEVEIVPGLENEFVNIRESTARMSVARMASLIEYVLAFCASNEIELHDTRRQGFLTEQAA